MATQIDDGQDGGAADDSSGSALSWVSGSEIQIEWAERIRKNVREELDRVAATFQTVADRQAGEKRAETEAVLAILADLRREILDRRDAGYFIRDWQEISDQVRRMIFADPRYQALKSKRSSQL